jgi:hypothetical protein
MMEDLENIKSIISDVIVGAIVAVPLAWALFKWLGEKWLDNKFSESLEDFKHEKNKEIARLKIEVDSLLNAKITFQKKNFEGLTEIWSSITNFQSCVANLIYKNLEFNNLELLSDKELEQLCKTKLDFSQDQYEAVRVSSNRNSKAVVQDDSNRIQVATKHQRDSSMTINKYRIFVDPKIISLSRKLQITLGNSLTKYARNYAGPKKQKIKAELKKEYEDDISTLADNLGKEIQKTINSVNMNN